MARRSLYLDIPSARRSPYSSSRRREGGGLLRKLGFTLLALIVIAIGVGAYQLTRTVPSQRAHGSFAGSVIAPGGTVALPWPSQGQAAVAVAGGATIAYPTSGARPAAIASLAKMMTAYQVLRDHPLGVTGRGPSFRVTRADVADYQRRAKQQQSLLRVRAGERLSELTALQAMLIPSANNVAVMLARWDAGSVAKFVQKMNATAKSLGMSQTHYADPDGISPATVSTASDQLTLAMKAMSVPIFAKTVRQPVETFPIAGALFNYNSMIGHHGFIGIKTGSDAAAGGCWAFAARRTVDRQPTTVFGVVLGQQAKKTGRLIQPALNLGLKLANATPTAVKRVTLVPAGTTVGTLTAPWRHDIRVTTKQAVTVVAAPGQKYVAQLQLHAPSGKSVAAGAVVGTLTVGGISTPLVATQSGSGPSLNWRLTRL